MFSNSSSNSTVTPTDEEFKNILYLFIYIVVMVITVCFVIFTYSVLYYKYHSYKDLHTEYLLSKNRSNYNKYKTKKYYVLKEMPDF
jgi:hypothetical protein